LQADVNYGYAIAFTTYGTIGVKVWIFRGFYEDPQQVLETDVRPGGAGPRRGRR
jgi:small subunit ribosomal protein S3